MKSRLHTGRLSRQVYGMLFGFVFSILMVIGVKTVQTTFILEPHSSMLSQVQNISQFMKTQDEIMALYNSYRWDYGDPVSFVGKAEQLEEKAEDYLTRIGITVGEHGKEQYLLFQAVRNLFDTFRKLNKRVYDELLNEDAAEASSLYYNKVSYCGSYIKETAEELLATAISDTRVQYEESLELGNTLEKLQTVTMLLTLIMGFMLLLTLVRVFNNVHKLSEQSTLLASGTFAIPDLDDKGDDEIGEMAHSFNAMKHFMENQVSVLEEKNRIQGELFAKDNETLRLKGQLEASRLQQLRSQINPHFLFNTINVIKVSASEEGAVNTEAMLSSLAKLYRYALGQNSENVPLSRELRIIEALAALYKARFGESFVITWKSYLEEDLTKVIVPSFILQPLVENAYEHGLKPKGYGHICVIAKEREGKLVLEVMDDGIGMDEATLARTRERMEERQQIGEHIGLYNVAARVSASSTGGDLEIETKEGEGTTVRLILPLVMEKEEEEDV